MYAASVLKSMLGQATTGVIPAELQRTNRVMERWAVANGSGLPSAQWDDNPRRSRVPPLDDHTALVVDQIVQHSPPRTSKLVKSWYMSPLPTSEIARQLSMSPRSVEKGLNVCLIYLKYRFESSGHLTLLKLLRVRV
jgi:hypothetical protein